MEYHLAQLNIGRTHEPLTSARLAGFMAMLDPINALADAAPGFVWRLQTEEGDATAIKWFDGDELMIVNLSVWESVETLTDFVFRTLHADVLRQRRDWFEQMPEAYTVAWWVPGGTEPTVGEAMERLTALRELGPSEIAFTLQRPFPQPE